MNPGGVYMKIGLFSKNVEEKEVVTSEEMKETGILDLEVIKYVINEFPEIANDIKDSLENLTNTIEKSINIIEDKSNEVIKADRDYELGGKYRDTSKKLYEISKSISEYIKWMNSNLKKDDIQEVVEKKNDQSFLDEEAKDIDIDFDEIIKKFIYEDFTGSYPIKITLDSYEQEVDGWDDLIVKTADMLNKKFKYDKRLKYNSANENVEVSSRKSKQNDSRNIVIEMLKEHNINLNNFKVFVKG